MSLLHAKSSTFTVAWQDHNDIINPVIEQTSAQRLTNHINTMLEAPTTITPGINNRKQQKNNSEINDIDRKKKKPS